MEHREQLANATLYGRPDEEKKLPSPLPALQAAPNIREPAWGSLHFQAGSSCYVQGESEAHGVEKLAHPINVSLPGLNADSRGPSIPKSIRQVRGRKYREIFGKGILGPLASRPTPSEVVQQAPFPFIMIDVPGRGAALSPLPPVDHTSGGIKHAHFGARPTDLSFGGEKHAGFSPRPPESARGEKGICAPNARGENVSNCSSKVQGPACRDDGGGGSAVSSVPPPLHGASTASQPSAAAASVVDLPQRSSCDGVPRYQSSGHVHFEDSQTHDQPSNQHASPYPLHHTPTSSPDPHEEGVACTLSSNTRSDSHPVAHEAAPVGHALAATDERGGRSDLIPLPPSTPLPPPPPISISPPPRVVAPALTHATSKLGSRLGSKLGSFFSKRMMSARSDDSRYSASSTDKRRSAASDQSDEPLMSPLQLRVEEKPRSMLRSIHKFIHVRTPEVVRKSSRAPSRRTGTSPLYQKSASPLPSSRGPRAASSRHNGVLRQDSSTIQNESTVGESESDCRSDSDSEEPMEPLRLCVVEEKPRSILRSIHRFIRARTPEQSVRELSSRASVRSPSQRRQRSAAQQAKATAVAAEAAEGGAEGEAAEGNAAEAGAEGALTALSGAEKLRRKWRHDFEEWMHERRLLEPGSDCRRLGAKEEGETRLELMLASWPHHGWGVSPLRAALTPQSGASKSGAFSLPHSRARRASLPPNSTSSLDAARAATAVHAAAAEGGKSRNERPNLRSNVSFTRAAAQQSGTSNGAAPGAQHSRARRASLPPNSTSSLDAARAATAVHAAANGHAPHASVRGHASHKSARGHNPHAPHAPHARLPNLRRQATTRMPHLPLPSLNIA